MSSEGNKRQSRRAARERVGRALEHPDVLAILLDRFLDPAPFAGNGLPP